MPIITRLDESPRLVLLGDPGSGKSTFVNYVTMCLCGERLGRTEANLTTLVRPDPEDESDQPHRKNLSRWTHGPLLPARVILRDFAARGLPAVGQTATGDHLWKFMVAELGEALGDWGEAFKRELMDKGGLVLLDGLDEVPEAGKRRVQLRQAVEGFAQTFGKCRLVVTGRTYAYQKQEWRLPAFETTVLAPFSHEQIHAFIERWYVYIAEVRDLKDGSARAQDLWGAIERNARLAEFAERPLLLTLMASLHAWRNGPLPENREELYNDAVDLLLDLWERPKRVVGERQPGLTEVLNTDKTRLRQTLNELAFQAHSAQPDLAGTADVDEGKLVSALISLSREEDINPIELVDYLSQRAGLLLPRGVGVYTFPHRTFQEYLAACYLTDHDYPDQLCRLVRADFERWREVARLAGAKATRGMGGAIWSLAEALCECEPEESTAPTDVWTAYLAGQALAESSRLDQVSRRDQPKLARIKRWLVRGLGDRALPGVERAQVGEALARLGDPRSEITDVEGMEFCYVPAGDFVMGDGKSKHINHALDYTYWLTRHPVSVAQWRQFVSSSGYSRVREDWPHYADNRPMLGVTWDDAQAFCAWLQDRFSAVLPVDFELGLPSEAEWEKAARGGRQVPEPDALIRRPLWAGLVEPASLPLVDNADPGRAFPWGSTIDPEKLNFEKTEIGTTSALGCFPDGASPYGCLDLAGNVWEWTRSLHEKYPYVPTDGREHPISRDSRVARGGAFNSEADRARCTFRYWYYPLNRFDYFGFRVVASPFLSSL